MSKEWILNSATNRFQLNFKRNVGAVSEAIRKCSPKTIKDWEDYYYENIKPREHIIDLGRKLFIKITEVLISEIEGITEQDCIDYIKNLVIERTFEGYQTEITTIYKQLESLLEMKIFPATDECDRIYNVDFYIKVKDKFIGLQIKPVSDVSQITHIYKEREIQRISHEKFLRKFGGKVFYVYSIKEDNKRRIHNIGIVEEIKSEISRLNLK